MKVNGVADAPFESWAKRFGSSRAMRSLSLSSRFIGIASFAVIRMVRRHGPGAVQRLGEQHPHQAVRQREIRETPAVIGAGLQRRVEPVGAADQKGDVAAIALEA